MVIDSVAALIATCEDSIVVALLVRENCSVSGPNQYLELCPGDMVSIGDSVWTDTGDYEMHLLSAGGCDSVFQVIINLHDSIQIDGVVWVDVDQNGIISPADTAIQGVTVWIDEGINHAPYEVITDVNGTTHGYYKDAAYFIYIDSTNLPGNFEVILGQTFVFDTVCGQASYAFLITGSCQDVQYIQNQILCPGDSAFIEGQWITDEGMYTFLLSEPGAGCDTTLNVNVAISDSIQLSGITDWNCIDMGTIQLQVMGNDPFTFYWTNGANGDTLVTGLDDGIYTVIVSDEAGCETTAEFEIQSPEPLSFSITDHYTIHEGDSVLVNIVGDINEPGLQFSWSPASIIDCPTCLQSLVYPFQDTVINIRITDADSCIYDLAASFIVIEDSTIADRIYIPNVFSPNGDGVNDRWTLYSRLPNTHVEKLMIFDYWGELLFEKSEFDLTTFEGWNGMFRGRPMNPGVFVYVGELTLGDGRQMKVKGDITLIR